MLILSLDSAGNGCGACVWEDGKVLASAEEPMERGQDQRLMPLILDVMKKAGVAFKDLDRVAVTRGPGSFTGLRIGLAAARGIGFAANKPVIGIDRFSIFHAQMDSSKDCFVIINSKRKELFCTYYPANAAAHEPKMMTIEEIQEFLKGKNAFVTGDTSLLGISFVAPQEKETVIAAMLAAKADPKGITFLPRPLYLRAPDVTLKAS